MRVYLLAAPLLVACNLIRVNGKPLDGGDPQPEPQPAAAEPQQPQARPIPPGARTVLDLLPAPPKECPDKKVLLTGRSNLHEFGYYIIKKEPFGKIVGLGEPDERHIRLNLEAIREKHPFERTDHELAFLWGTWCAYPESKLVAAALAERRKAYTAEHDISPGAEKKLHLALIDERVVQGYDDRCGPRPEQPTAADLPLMLACGSFPASLFAAAWKTMDDGDETPLAPAAVAIACDKLETSARGAGYVRYRICRADVARAPVTDVMEAFAKLDDPILAHLGRRNYRAGVAHLDEVGAEVARYERGFPAEKKRVDEVFARLDRELVPQLAELRRAVRFYDAFRAKADEGPGNVEGCADRLRTRVAERVAKLERRGTALLDRLREPITAHLALALETCLRTLGQPDEARSLYGVIRQPASLIRGYHSGLARDLNDRPTDRYLALVSAEHGEADRYAGGEVRSTETTARGIIVHFKIDIWRGWVEDCEPDYRKPKRIMPDGTIVYASKNCKKRKSTIDNTVPDILIPPADAAAIRPGHTIQFFRTRDAKAKPWSSRIALVQSGKDILWAAGFPTR